MTQRKTPIQQRRFFSELRGKPFWIWGIHQHQREYIETNKRCCFNHIVGLPRKNGKEMPLFDYEKIICDALQEVKHVWIKKATGLGITELMLRYMAWLCLKDDALKGSRMCVVTGPRIDLAINLIDRIKELFPTVRFDMKQTTVSLNDIVIEAFPSHHIDAMRGLPNISFILLDEADFFPPGQQQDARHVSERYIAKSNPYIVMVSTPNAPGGLFEQIEKEHEANCLYKRIKLDYSYGLGKIYTDEEIGKAKASPSFDREYDLKYAGKIGNVFHSKYIDAAIERGKQYEPLGNGNPLSPKSIGIDPAFGSSNFAFVVTQLNNSGIEVLYAEEFERPSFDQMIEKAMDLRNRYDIEKIYVDGANPAIITALKNWIGERTDYDEHIAELRRQHLDPVFGMDVLPVSFGTEHKAMLGHAKMMLEKGQIAINPIFDKLILSLRTAVEQEGMLVKADTLYNDIFDAFRLALKYYVFE